MGLPWDCDGTAMGRPHLHFTTMGPPWDFHEVTMGCHGTPIRLSWQNSTAMGLPWDCLGSAMGLPRNGIGLPWDCH